MHCIKKDSGNLLVRAPIGKEFIYFSIDPKTGIHLNEKAEEHSVEFYRRAVLDWTEKGIPLPKENVSHAEAIVKRFLKKRKLKGTYMISAKATYDEVASLISEFEEQRQ